MNESESKSEKLKESRRFSQEQYDMLKRCSDKKDITEWNEWRKKHPDEDVLLEGAVLSGACLDGALLNGGGYKNAITEEYEKFEGKVHLENANLRRASLKNAKLWGAFLQNAHVGYAHLEGADLCYAQLKNAYLMEAHLEDAIFLEANLKYAELSLSELERAMLTGAHLESADLTGANLKEAHLENAHLEGSNLRDADLQKAEVGNAHLEGAKLQEASLMSTHFLGATVDGNTNMWKVGVNQFTIRIAKSWHYTDFSGVPLENVIVDPPTKQLIKYNVRRKYWYKWITEKNWYEVFHDESNIIPRTFLDRYIHSLIHLFFWISDYGLRTWRIIVTFFGLAITFAVVYRLCPTFVMVNQVVGDIRGFWHALYFSVVTMTTLGFGDIAANPDSWGGQTLLMLQVILGYVLLGALITRFAVLFTAGGPTGRFANEQEKKGQGE